MILILAHHSRRNQALALWDKVGGKILWDYENRGASWNHHRALEHIAEHGQAIIIEDDAILTSNFTKKAEWWIKDNPGRVISFYLGTGRPVWAQERIMQELQSHEGKIELPGLYFGVCYTVTQTQARKALERLAPTETIDINIGYAIGEPVIYTVPSLANHSDGESVETHPDGESRTQKRVAYCFEE